MLENLKLGYLLHFMTAPSQHILIIRSVPNKASITKYGRFRASRPEISISISKYKSKGSVILQQIKRSFSRKNCHKMTENVFLFVPNLIGK